MDEIENYLEKIKKPVSLEKILEKAKNIYGLDYEQVKSFIDEKVKNYELIITENGNYIPIKKTSFRVGFYHGFKDGSGAVETNDSRYLISKENSSKVIDGDLVLIDIFNKQNNSSVIKRIIKRDTSKIAGEIEMIGNNYYVIPEDKKLRKLTILLEGQDYIEGEKVIVNCTQKQNDNLYIGEITKIIGHKNEPYVDVLMEAYKFKVDNEITKEEVKELELIPMRISDFDRIGRMDFTKKEIFTIDGADTKDIDDAISLEILPNGNYLLGVYIADVSHYVLNGSLLDLRARRKGTSSYLADSVIPMLPPKLSNGICSLNPHVDRLALGCLMEFDSNGNRIRYSINQFVINSKIKMTYEKVNDILEKELNYREYDQFVLTLRRMEIFANKLLKKRLLRGSIDLDKPELKLIMDNNGKVADFSIRYQKTAESMIEEFMLVTNETIAEDMFKRNNPLLYRNHEKPDIEKMEEYLLMLKSLGYEDKFNINDPLLGKKLSEYIKQDDYLATTLKIKLLRSFRKAFYSPENYGHYGLASDYYCHFTSPIRRYPDLINHRLIKEFRFSEENKNNLKKKWKNQLDEIARTSSEKERNADALERMVTLMKCAEYMENHIGENYSGTVIGISDSGLEIELDNMITGMVRLKDLNGKYIYSQINESFTSLNNHEDYYLGDRLNLCVSYANKEKKEIDFKVVEKIVENDRVKKTTNNKERIKQKSMNNNIRYYNVKRAKKV